MNDVLGSNPVQLSTTEPTLAARFRPATHGLSRPILFALASFAALLVLSADASVAASNTQRAGAIGYLTYTLVLFGCACSFWIRARCAQGTLRLRWSLISGAALAASIGFLPSFIEILFNTGPARQFQTACFNISEALYILSTVLFFANVARSIVLVDIVQSLLFVALRFNLTYSAVNRDHFALTHLIVGQFVALFLFVVALVACLGAASSAELKFLRILSWFFFFRLVGFFLSNQVSYTWLHYNNCSLWDLVSPALLSVFALYLLYTRPATQDQTPATAPLHPSIVVRSLMPSFLALVNLMLGLFLLQISVLLAAVAILVSVLCYVVRTVLLQAQVLEEKALLECRNQQLEGLIIRDPLTGIGNRRSLAGAYVCLAAAGKPLSLLLIDIDCFKQANDSHGHLYGDKILILLARRLEALAATVAGSHCARLGGDEFTLLLPDITPQAAAALAETLRTSFSEQANDGIDGNMSLSIGLASLSSARDLPLETLVSSADEALYRAKLQGRNRVEIHTVADQSTITASPLSPDLHHIAT